MAERGRPKKPKSERRSRQLHIVITKAEQGAIEDAAKAQDLSMSAWARRTLLIAAKTGQDSTAE